MHGGNSERLKGIGLGQHSIETATKTGTSVQGKLAGKVEACGIKLGGVILGLWKDIRRKRHEGSNKSNAAGSRSADEKPRKANYALVGRTA